jgi:sporulation protein YlmC with PRC-barrel domain
MKTKRKFYRTKNSPYVKTLKLSEVVINHETQKRVLGKPVVAPDGRELGVVNEVYLNRDLTARKVVVKDSSGLSFVLDARRLILKDDTLILQEPSQADLMRAMKETCKALLELLEACAVDDPKDSLPELSAAREHLKTALKAMEKA